MLFQTEGGPKFRDLEKEDLNQNLGNRHFVLIDQWGLAVQLVIYETKDVSLQVCIQPCHR